METTHDLAKQFFGKFSYRGVMGILTIAGSFIFLFLLMFKPIPAGNETAVNVAMGFVLGVGIGGVINYYFGASKDKSDTDKAANVSSILEASKETPVITLDNKPSA